LAYAIKIPLIPFHSWQANVYRLAPTTGTMLLSGIMLKMGLYSVIRWQLPIAPATAVCYQTLFIGLSIAGVVYGSIAALRQGHLKTLLAYSSLAHVGLIAAGCYTLTVDGLVGAVHQMIAHGFVIVGLFFTVEIIFRRAHTFQIEQLGGIRQQNRVFASLFLILVLASVAMPGTYNFVGEFTVLYSLSQVQWYWALIGGTTIILGAYYMLRMFQHVMLGPSEKVSFTVLKSSETLSLILVIGFLLFFGLYPKPITDLVTPSIEKIILIINR
jgi:NADH-quinone oxidoreductase subunit M